MEDNASYLLQGTEVEGKGRGHGSIKDTPSLESA